MVTGVGRELEQQDAAGPQGHEAQAEGQRVGRGAGAQPGAPAARHHGYGRTRRGVHLFRTQTTTTTKTKKKHELVSKDSDSASVQLSRRKTKGQVTVKLKYWENKTKRTNSLNLGCEEPNRAFHRLKGLTERRKTNIRSEL